MKIEMDVDTISFNGLKINADELSELLVDDTHFYHFSNDGESIYIERFEARTLGSMIHNAR